MKIENKLLLTKYQSVFYYEWAKDPKRTDYNMVLDNTIIGDLDINRLNNSFIRFHNDYFILNSNVASEDGILYWKQRNYISNESSLAMVYNKDLTEEQILDLAQAPFDLENDLLFKYNVIKYGENKYRLIYIYSHIIIDGFSQEAIFLELSKYYNDAKYKSNISINDQIFQHNELYYSLDTLLEKNRDAIDIFWRNRLKGITSVNLSFLRNDSSEVLKNSVDEFEFIIDSENFNLIKKTSRKYGITPFVFGQLVFGILIHRYSGIKRFAIDSTVSITEGKELYFGAHVNTILIDFDFENNLTLESCIHYIYNYYKELKSSKSKYLPINELIKYSSIRELEIGFVQTVFRDNSINYDRTKVVDKSHQFHVDLANKVLFEQEMHDQTLNYRVRYNCQHIDKKLIKTFTDSYFRLFLDIAHDLSEEYGQKEISEYDLLEPKEYDKIVYKWNQPFSYYPKKTIHSIFESQVLKTPFNIALIFNDNKITYQELNEKANKLAHFIVSEHSISSRDIVAIFTERSEYLIISILAVLKTGASYLPIDPKSSMDRINMFIADSKPKLILTCELTHNNVSTINNIKTLSVNSEATLSKISSLSHSNLGTCISHTDLAYIIYTSGSTGHPKGVMVEHKSVINLVNSLSKKYNFKAGDDVILLFSNYIFDTSVEQIFLALLSGSSLLVIKDKLWEDIDEFSKTLIKNNVSYIDLTPSVLKQIKLPDLASLRFMISGGEAIPKELIKKIHRDTFKFINAYGPTETTVTSLVYEIGENNFIGRPIANTTAYVLDQQLRPLPVGAIGELYIGGEGVARGYLNNPKLTEERFIANPFQTNEDRELGYNDRIYKTGDLVRYMPDGNLEYIGRNDFQVKIRGFRIELGEIETKMAAIEGIKHPVVIAYENAQGNKFLAGYYVGEETLNHEEITSMLHKGLPEYMVPSVYVY